QRIGTILALEFVERFGSDVRKGARPGRSSLRSRDTQQIRKFDSSEFDLEGRPYARFEPGFGRLHISQASEKLADRAIGQRSLGCWRFGDAPAEVAGDGDVLLVAGEDLASGRIEKLLPAIETADCRNGPGKFEV